MATKFAVEKALYKNLVKPVLFAQDAENVHERALQLGSFLGEYPLTRTLVKSLFSYSNPTLETTVCGVTFKNPVGLAAGFDYNGNLAAILGPVGFGFNTVGTVTAKPYAGNSGPRLTRLPKSRALLVNKGFKSLGADAVCALLDAKELSGSTVGISVGSSNIPQVNSLASAIDDYLYTFSVFGPKKYVSYFELNISCPNVNVDFRLSDPKVFGELASAVAGLGITQPIFVKMPNEIAQEDLNVLVELGLKHGLNGVILSNLVKNRGNSGLDADELKKVAGLKGNFSGKPTELNANNLIAGTHARFGKDVAIIGCGGIFTPQDALAKLQLGASLVQLITGMVFEGPQLAGEINFELTMRGVAQ